MKFSANVASRQEGRAPKILVVFHVPEGVGCDRPYIKAKRL